MSRKPGRPNPELAKPRVANGGGPMPTHVSYIFAESGGRYRLQIHQRGTLRSRLGFHRELICANEAEFDAQMEFLVASRVPFMVGHMIMGPSDDAYFWLKGKGRRVDYLEIAYGGKTEWRVREIFEDAKEWRGVKLDELLGPEIDLFAPENRPRVERPEPPPPPPPLPSPPPPSLPEPPPEPPQADEPPPPPAPAEPAPAPDPAPSPEPKPEPAADRPPPEDPPPPAEADAPSASPTPGPAEKSTLPGQRWVEYGSATILLALVVASFWRATAYFQYIVPVEPGPVFSAVALTALAGSTVYAAVWLTLFPRYFPRWTDRLQLLALSLIACILIAFCEVMIANIRYDDAPRVTLQTVVKDKTIFKGKYGRHPPEHWAWNITVESWADPADEVILRVSRETWEAIAPGQRIAFRPHPGRLGWIWYTKEELESPDFVSVVQR